MDAKTTTTATPPSPKTAAPTLMTVAKLKTLLRGYDQELMKALTEHKPESVSAQVFGRALVLNTGRFQKAILTYLEAQEQTHKAQYIAIAQSLKLLLDKYMAEMEAGGPLEDTETEQGAEAAAPAATAATPTAPAAEAAPETATDGEEEEDGIPPPDVVGLVSSVKPNAPPAAPASTRPNGTA